MTAARLAPIRAALTAGAPADALALLDAPPLATHPTVEILLLRADALLALARPEAEAAYRAVLALSPREPAALLGLGRAARARGDAAESLAAFEAAHRADPKSLKPLDALIRAHREAGRWPEALATATAALARAPNHLPALLAQGQAAQALGDPASALAAFAAARRLAPDDLRPLDALLRLHREAGDAVALAETARAALALAPAHPPALLALAHHQRQTGDAAAALATLAPIAATAAGRLERARLLLEEASPAAIAEAEALLATHPDRPRALRLLGRAALDRGAFAEARAALEAIASPDAESLLALALLAWREGKAAEARTRIAAAEALAPQDPRPFELQARLAREAERHAEAVELLRAALARNPASPEAVLALPAALAAIGAFEDAAAAADEAERHLGPGPRIALLRTAALRRQGHWPEALAIARAAAAAPEAAPPALALERARLELLLAGPGPARAILAAARPQTAKDRAERLLVEALIAEESWDFEAAGRLLAEAAALQPRHPELRLNAARNALLRLDTEGARAHLRDAMGIRAAARRQAGRSNNISQTHAGQILDELTLDPPLLASLRALRALPAAERLAPLAGLLRDNPESTAAAMQLLLAHREIGPLDRAPPDPAATIPATIGQFWTDPEPPSGIQALMASWPRHHPAHAIARFDNAAGLRFLQSHFSRAVAAAFLAAKEPAMRADLFRLAWLFAEGGLYADADDRCLAPLATLLAPGRGLILYLEPWGTAGNNFIAATPGHPILRDALHRAVAAILRGDRDSVWLATGPGLITRAVAAALAARGGLPPGVALLDRPLLHRHVAMHCFVAYKAGARHWSQAEFKSSATQPRASSSPNPRGLS